MVEEPKDQEGSIPLSPDMEEKPLSPRERDPGLFFAGKPWGWPVAGLMLLFLANLLFCLVTVLIGPLIFIPEMEGKELPAILGLLSMEGVTAVIYYLFLVVVITLSFYKAFRDDGKEFLNLVKQEGGELGPGRVRSRSPSLFSPYLNNVFILVPLLFFSVFCFEFFHDILVTNILGISRHVPSTLTDSSNWFLLYIIPEAPVLEELVNRTLVIGVPLYFIHNLGARNDAEEKSVEV